MKLFVLNYSAPSLVSENIQKANSMIVGHAMMDIGPEPAGILLSPIHTYTQGSLFMQEHTILKQLHNSGVGVDCQIQLCIDPKSKTDSRSRKRKFLYFQNQCCGCGPTTKHL